jgi:hypothetical protein
MNPGHDRYGLQSNGAPDRHRDPEIAEYDVRIQLA